MYLHTLLSEAIRSTMILRRHEILPVDIPQKKIRVKNAARGGFFRWPPLPRRPQLYHSSVAKQ